MNKKLKKQVSKYCRDISSFVICSSKQKREYIKELKNSINEMYEADPSLNIEDITEIFGTPRQIADSFKNETDAMTLKKTFSVKKMIFVFLLIALIVYIVFVVLSLIDVHTEAHGYFSEGFIYIKGFWGGEVL